MNAWSEGDILTNGTRLHYYRTGGSKPPLVMAHGITDDGLCWTPAAEAFSEDYDVIMVDLRGHGKSEAPERGYDLVTMAMEVAGMITGLGLEKPIILGHSLGAVITLTLAGINPDNPRAIILEDPPAFWHINQESIDDADGRAGMQSWIEALKRKTRDDLLAEGRLENPGWSEAELDPWVDSKHRFSLKIIQMIDLQVAVPADFPTLLTRITCPVLLITADPKQGAILTDNDVARLLTSVPHLERTHIPDAGHNIRREQLTQYINTVENYLAGLVW